MQLGSTFQNLSVYFTILAGYRRKSASIDSVKAFDKIQHSFIIMIKKKHLSKLEVKESFLILSIYKEPASSSYFLVKDLSIFLLRLE